MQLEREAFHQVLSAALLAADKTYPHNRVELTLGPDSVRAVGTNGHILAVAERPANMGPKEAQVLVLPRTDTESLVKLVKPVKGENEQMSIELNDSYKLSVEVGALSRHWFLDSAEQDSFPPWVRVLPPVLTSSTIEPTSFNPDYIALVAKIAKVFGTKEITSLPPRDNQSPHQWDAPCDVDHNRLSIVLMPMRTSYKPRSFSGISEVSPVAAE